MHERSLERGTSPSWMQGRTLTSSRAPASHHDSLDLVSYSSRCLLSFRHFSLLSSLPRRTHAQEGKRPHKSTHAHKRKQARARTRAHKHAHTPAQTHARAAVAAAAVATGSSGRGSNSNSGHGSRNGNCCFLTTLHGNCKCNCSLHVVQLQ